MAESSVEVIFVRSWRAYPDGFTERLFHAGESYEIPQHLAQSWTESGVCKPAKASAPSPLPLEDRETKPFVFNGKEYKTERAMKAAITRHEKQSNDSTSN